MLRHGCGYKLANDGHDTRAIQHYLGHRSYVSTVRYTALAPDRFKGLLAGLGPIHDRPLPGECLWMAQRSPLTGFQGPPSGPGLAQTESTAFPGSGIEADGGFTLPGENFETRQSW